RAAGLGTGPVIALKVHLRRAESARHPAETAMGGIASRLHLSQHLAASRAAPSRRSLATAVQVLAWPNLRAAPHRRDSAGSVSRRDQSQEDRLRLPTIIPGDHPL